MRNTIAASFLILAALAVAPLTQAQSTAHATLAEQRMCAEQASKEVSTTYAMNRADTTQDFVNHYDATTHTCYLLLHNFVQPEGQAWFHSYEVYDAFEGTELGYLAKNSSGVFMCEMSGLPSAECPVGFFSYIARQYGLKRGIF